MAKINFQSIDEYIRIFPHNVADILRKVRKTIIDAAPDATETISYQMPTFKLNGKNLVHFAAWKNHIGFYPTPSGTEKFKKDISKYHFAKGSIQFPLDQSIPYSLITKIVKFRTKEIPNKENF